MSKPKSLQRLLRIREIEEERKRLELAAALGRLDRLSTARDAAVQRAREGRSLVASSALSGDVADRQAGLMETETARRRARMLDMQIVQCSQETNTCREEFLSQRKERRQAETVLQQQVDQEKREDARRSQSNLDDWFGIKAHCKAAHQREGED